MNADLAPILLAGLVAVLAATTALVMLVRGDLAHAAGDTQVLNGGGQWFLGAALGIGVIAFAIKLGIILTLSSFPEQTIAPLIPDPADTVPRADGVAALPVVVVPFAWQTLPPMAPAPADNPTTPAKVVLGERLFHDAALSRDRTVSCASCHDVATGVGTDGRPTAIGITGVPGSRNTPTVWNAAFQARLFWDGRARSLEEQAAGPPLNPNEMGMPSFAAIEERIAADLSYQAAFAQAFGDGEPITMRRITQAIAAYERTLVVADSPYDRLVTGDPSALSPEQMRGMGLFRSIGCAMCHSGPNFSGAAMIGPRNPFAPLVASRSERARAHGLQTDKGLAGAGSRDGVWRIPSLRNVALTPPYFHNGSITDLAEAVRVMATAQLGAVISDDPAFLRRGRPMWSALSQNFTINGPLVLGSGDISDLVAFLHALSSDRLANRAAAR
ncbi:MAG: hypothetical protein NVV74_18450 [Magnetospirillum sp.]|nr:hypothetical protein [Magnetospirillum sp.]